MGLHRAFPDAEITGVDIKPQPHYPFKFVQADAMMFSLEGYDFIWASCPCQRFSKSVTIENRKKHPDYIFGTRERLTKSRKPFVIENVPRSPLLNPVMLCGTSFNLGVARHRLFESNFPIRSLPCNHEKYEPKYPPAWNRKNKLRFVAVSGGWSNVPHKEAQRAMGIDWMNSKELSEAIPPAYSEWIGNELKKVLQ